MSLKLHPGQSEIFSDLFVTKTVQHAVAVTSRGYGKSHLGAVAGIAAVFELLQLKASIPNKNVVIVAPTHSQVTDIYHPLLLYQLGMEAYVIDHSRALGRLVFPNNVELKLVSYEAIDRLRGTGAFFVVADEVRDWTTGIGHRSAWESVLMPIMTTRWSPAQAEKAGAKSCARSLTISTPKGFAYLHDMAHFCEVDDRYKTYIADHTKAPLLDQAEVERARATTDPITFAQEYLASFKDSGANVFYCFDRKVHVRKDLEPVRLGTDKVQGETVNVCIDFNVLKQASSVFVERGSEVQFIHEFIGSADTETLAISIKAVFWPNYNKEGHPEYKKKVCKIVCFPDPSGKSRKTSAVIGTTDFTILQSHGFEVLSHSAAPSIVDSVACVNRMLLTADGKVHMYVASHLKGVIESLERTAWLDKNPDTASIDKSAGIEHFSDGIRYGIEYKFPIKSAKKAAARGFNF